MKDEMIDRILASEEALLPSSGFTAAVMDRIRQEAAAPLPISFPWKRIVPGIVLGCGGLGWGAVELTRLAIAAAHDPQTITVPLSASALQPFESLGWAALALVVALATWFVSQRMSGESQLL
jgi:hypothetical protein